MKVEGAWGSASEWWCYKLEDQIFNNLVLILWSCIKRSLIMSSRHGSAEVHTEFRWGQLEGSNYFEDVAVCGKIRGLELQ